MYIEMMKVFLKCSVLLFYMLTLGMTMDAYPKEAVFKLEEEREQSLKSFDDDLRGGIYQHTKNFETFFNPLLDKQMKNFLSDLGKLVHLGILFRADNLDFIDDILRLRKDYEKLNYIISPTSNMRDVNHYLMEIHKNHDQMLPPNLKGKINMHTSGMVTRQLYCLKVISWESLEYYQNMKSTLSKESDLKKKSLESIQTQINVQTQLSCFLTLYKDLMENIELERLSFYILLKKVCLSAKDMCFESMVFDFPVLIEGYQKILGNFTEEKKNVGEDSFSMTGENLTYSAEIASSSPSQISSSPIASKSHLLRFGSGSDGNFPNSQLSGSDGPSIESKRKSSKSESKSPKHKSSWWK